MMGNRRRGRLHAIGDGRWAPVGWQRRLCWANNWKGGSRGDQPRRWRACLLQRLESNSRSRPTAPPRGAPLSSPSGTDGASGLTRASATASPGPSPCRVASPTSVLEPLTVRSTSCHPCVASHHHRRRRRRSAHTHKRKRPCTCVCGRARGSEMKEFQSRSAGAGTTRH